MKKTLLPIFLFILINQSFSQDYVTEEPIEEIKVEVIRSDFSVGVSPIVFIQVNDYESDGPGLGLEFLGLYSLDNNFSVGGFIKVKAAINEVPIAGPGSGWNGNGTFLKDGAGSAGAIFEYKMFNKVGFNLRLGYEDYFTPNTTQQYNTTTGSYYNVYEDNSPGVVYGGGISLYIKRDDSKRALHSFNWGIIFESNNFTEFPILDISTNEFEDTKVNAFYVQFGWRIQFHKLKPEN